MPTYETLDASGDSYIEFTPEAGKAYRFTGLNELSASHTYIIQDASTNSPGTHTVPSGSIRTIAQAVTDGIVTKHTITETEYYLEFSNLYPVMVARITPTEAIVDFESSSGLNEDDLDMAIGQALRVSQEAREVTERAGYRNVSGTPETLGVDYGTSFVDSGDYWTFTATERAGTIASDFLVFVDGIQLAPSFLQSQTPDGTDGAFAVPKSAYPEEPDEWTVVYLKDYISTILTPGAASVGTTELANLAVTAGKIALGAVGTDQMADTSVTTGKIALGAVGTDQMADESVTAGKLHPDALPSLTAVPTGAIVPMAAATTPSGFLACDGAAVDRTTYADLFAFIGTTYGIGDGTTTFNLPDFRGYFLRGAGGTASEAIGTAQSDQLKAHTHGLTLRTSAYKNTNEGPNTYKEPWGTGVDSTASFGGSETRPMNYSVHYVIKT